VTQNTVRFVDHRRQDDFDHDDYDFFSMNVARQRSVTSSNLVMVNVQVNDRPCVALVDSGASHDMIDHRLVDPNHRVRQRRANVEGFDGANVVATTVSDYAESVQWPGTSFGHQDIVLTAWDFSAKDYDLILGKPWFDRVNLVIQWPTTGSCP
jgi:hypothetical protein